MRRSPWTRVAAVVSGVLLLQLSLLGSGTPCHMQHDAPATMDVSAMGMTHEHAGDAHVSTATSQPAPCHETGTCEAPWSPDAGCSSMATCIVAVSAILTSSPSTPLATVADRVAVVHSMDMPLGPAFAPELPPPRA